MTTPANGDDAEDELAQLRREVLRLRKANAALSGSSQILKEGTLFRYRAQMLSSAWKARYYDLRVNGSGEALLRCFDSRGKGVKHGAGPQGALRAVVRLGRGLEILREEGPSDGTPPHCFQVKLPVGAGPMAVLRLGVEGKEEADAWVEALEMATRDGDDAKDEAGMKPRVSQVSAGPPPPVLSTRSPLRLVHTTARTSVLTSEDERGIPDCNVVGILNLIVTVLVVLHLRLIADNFMKYGLLLDTFRHFGWVLSNPAHWRCFLCCAAMPVFALVALGVERGASARVLPGVVARTAHFINCASCLVVPCMVIRSTASLPPVGMALLMAHSVLFLKLVSYAHVNHALRRENFAKRRLSKDGQTQQESVSSDDDGKSLATATCVAYPSNLTMRDMMCFISFPTLVYQTSYPRTPRIRKRWLAKRFGEMFVCLILMSVIVEQFVVPTLQNNALPVLSFDVIRIFVAIMKLALPNVYLWLFMFYALFHLWLNILAELTCFGDRMFYKEWWNATKLEDYWRLWNLPVHHWLVKHVFHPAISAGLGKPVAVFLTFFVSAVFHELLVSVPCHTFRLWSFFGMMAQLPLVHITAAIDKRLKGSQLGNMLFWVSFCVVGQPLCVLLYFAQV